MRLDNSRTSATGVDPSSSPTTQSVGARIALAACGQIRVAQRAAGGEIAGLRRSRQHGAPAGQFVGLIVVKVLA